MKKQNTNLYFIGYFIFMICYLHGNIRNVSSNDALAHIWSTRNTLLENNKVCILCKLLVLCVGYFPIFLWVSWKMRLYPQILGRL